MLVIKIGLFIFSIGFFTYTALKIRTEVAVWAFLAVIASLLWLLVK